MKQIALTIEGVDGKVYNIGLSSLPSSSTSLSSVIQLLISLLLVFVIALSLLALIYTGYQWMTSMGDKQRIAQVKQRFIYVIVGLVVALLSFLIIGFVGNFFGVKLIR